MAVKEMTKQKLQSEDEALITPKPFAQLTPQELSALYSNFAHYRDITCNRRARSGVINFYKKFGFGAYDGGLTS
jgi:hypothetical protein